MAEIWRIRCREKGPDTLDSIDPLACNRQPQDKAERALPIKRSNSVPAEPLLTAELRFTYHRSTSERRTTGTALHLLRRARLRTKEWSDRPD
jgi:hypothetical protein